MKDFWKAATELVRELTALVKEARVALEEENKR